MILIGRVGFVLAEMVKSQVTANAQALASRVEGFLKEPTAETKERKFLKMLGKNYLDAEKDAPLLRELLNELDPHTQAAAAGGS